MPNPTDFDALYRSTPDPFEVGTSWYEQRKLAVAMSALTQPRYALAWDSAAGTGHLAVRLAARCGRVIATDASSVAIAALTRRARPDYPAHPVRPGDAKVSATPLPANVDASVSALPTLPSAARAADLVVVSEVLYYLDDDARAATHAMLSALDAEVLAVNWRHHPDDAYVSGEAAMAELAESLEDAGFVRAVRHEEADFIVSTHVPATTRPRDAS